jgi:hypothetical protein
MRNILNKSYRENQNQVLFLIVFFFRKSCRLCDNVEKYGTVAFATDDMRVAR